jgi:tetratricopeptide (TPR) repeat protein
MTNDDAMEPTEADDEMIDDELGYAECDWSTLPESSVDTHDEVIGLDYDALEELDVEALDDLGKWAAAQAFDDFGDAERFQDIALRIARSSNAHPAIDYAEIALELMNDYFLEERWDDAVFLLPDVERLVPEDPTIRARIGAQISLARGRVEEGMAVFQELIDEHEDDGAYLALLAQGLFEVGHDDEGEALLEKAEEVAELTSDEYALELIADFRAMLEAPEEE